MQFTTNNHSQPQQPHPSPPFFKKSLLISAEEDGAGESDTNRRPRVVLTRTAKNKMALYNVKESFAEYALNHGTYHESKVFANHYHVRNLGHELIITINPTDIVVITFHNTYNEESAQSEPCSNIYRTGFLQPDMSWIRGTKVQPARAKSTSPRHGGFRATSSPRAILRPSTTSPPPTTMTQTLRRSPLAANQTQRNNLFR